MRHLHSFPSWRVCSLICCRHVFFGVPLGESCGIACDRSAKEATDAYRAQCCCWLLPCTVHNDALCGWFKLDGVAGCSAACI